MVPELVLKLAQQVLVVAQVVPEPDRRLNHLPEHLERRRAQVAAGLDFDLDP